MNKLLYPTLGLLYRISPKLFIAVHLVISGVIFSREGFWAGLITACTPFVSELYWSYRDWGTDSWIPYMALPVLCLLLFLFLAIKTIAIVNRKENVREVYAIIERVERHLAEGGDISELPFEDRYIYEQTKQHLDK